MVVLEREIEKKLVTMVKRHGGLCLKWVCPGWSGVPDRILLLPGGQIYFIETKRPKDGRLLPLQLKWREWLTRLGFFCSTVWSVTDVEMLELVIIRDIDRG